MKENSLNFNTITRENDKKENKILDGKLLNIKNDKSPKNSLLSSKRIDKKSKSNPTFQTLNKKPLISLKIKNEFQSRKNKSNEKNSKNNTSNNDKNSNDGSISNEDLLIVVGYNNNENKTINRKSLSNPFLRYGKLLNEKSKNIKNKISERFNYSYSKNLEYKNEMPKEKIIYKPLKLAGTLYKDLCQKKIYFMNKIKEKQNIIKGETLSEINKNKYKTLNKVDFEMIRKEVVSSYLNKKLYNNIPITYPLYLSFRNNYESQSEKKRQEKIIEKFIQLKTQIKNQPENENLLLKEFLFKNGIDNPNNYNEEKLNNLSSFLNHPFNFDSKKRIKEIINEGLNYKPTDEELIKDQNKLKVINYFLNGEKTKKDIINYSPIFYKKIKAFSKTLYSKKKNILDLIDQEKLYENINKQENNNRSLNEMINSLEEEFKQINNEKISINGKQNKKINQIYKTKKYEDHNKFVPNLCLSSKDFYQLYLKRVEEENKKNNNMKYREAKIKELNDRLYYGKKNGNKTIDIDKIRRRHKLTEFIFLNKIKNKVLLEEKKKELENMPF